MSEIIGNDIFLFPFEGDNEIQAVDTRTNACHVLQYPEGFCRKEPGRLFWESILYKENIYLLPHCGNGMLALNTGNYKLDYVGLSYNVWKKHNWEVLLKETAMKNWMECHSVRNFSLYGFSYACKCMINMLVGTYIEIDKIYDSNVIKLNTYKGYDVVPPDVHEVGSDAVIITSVYQDEIKEKLKKLDYNYKGSVFYIEDVISELGN